ncbi:Accessory subunit of the mitochondrial membrane respiratory chain NADH dehydrogenase (Complex I) [Seminavis robusta]|uniref:Accessory subunit of the mitochondrial membrane respiratory chain NADH dehydrogenase (Complex I) n=1 Tax=Seminavis robusta TaxID=568900 RepID=A0A9N8HAN6_9STRA|nr:Accessory subunit of the mitochondrial membrane respiratory chain NADH dehydrogenase (Complex I) [Seminavis robusta]|eukprot:Sro326_g118170.1 Accessory subunit of the mitochondrial membrane respiratory chain NADH dehydrogenase (Complex I) (227) ;mRNA; r:50982-51857
MSWKAGLSRHLPALRFFACPKSPSSKGVMTWYVENYEELKLLNPEMPLLMRTTDNAMPAVTTQLDWTTQHLLGFMVQENKFRDANGTISQARVEAAQDYMKFPWEKLLVERFSIPGFDPEKPFLDEEKPGWRDDPEVQSKLATYFSLKDSSEELEATFTSGPDKEFERAKNALLMCQRVDLWCAGPKEVEAAVVHLYKLGKALQEREVDFPVFITEFIPGADDLQY